MKSKSTAEITPHQFNELEKLLATTQEELNGEEQQVEDLEDQVDTLTMQIEDLEKYKTELEISLEDVRLEMRTMANKNVQLENLVKSMSKEAAKVAEQKESTASMEVRRLEHEKLLGNTKRLLEDALIQNDALHGKVKKLESEVEKSQQTNAQTLEECESYEAINNEMTENIRSLESQLVTLTKENQSLLERSASFAEKDQLQKASLKSSNQEITALMDTVANFQNRFTSMAKQITEGQAEREAMEKEHGEEGAKWIAKRTELEEYATRLQSELDEIQEKYDEMEKKYAENFAKKDSEWQVERVALNTRITHLENANNEAEEKLSDAYQSSETRATDTSMLKQKVSKLEQEIQLLDITLADKTQEHLQAAAELDETNQKLRLCEERLEACEQELESSKAEHKSLVVKSTTDEKSFREKILALETELDGAITSIESATRQRESTDTEHKATKTSLQDATDALRRSQKEILAREKKIQEIEVMMANELQTAMEKHQMLQSKYDACAKDLAACKSVLSEKKPEGNFSERKEDSGNRSHDGERIADRNGEASDASVQVRCLRRGPRSMQISTIGEGRNREGAFAETSGARECRGAGKETTSSSCKSQRRAQRGTGSRKQTRDSSDRLSKRTRR